MKIVRVGHILCEDGSEIHKQLLIEKEIYDCKNEEELFKLIEKHKLEGVL